MREALCKRRLRSWLANEQMHVHPCIVPCYCYAVACCAVAGGLHNFGPENLQHAYVPSFKINIKETIYRVQRHFLQLEDT